MIDVGSANSRASELRGSATSLRSISSLLEQYQGDVEGNWQSAEVLYYVNAINNVQSRLNQAANELDSIADAVSNTASQIRSEEEEAARQAAAAAAAAAAQAAAAQAAAAQAAAAQSTQNAGQSNQSSSSGQSTSSGQSNSAAQSAAAAAAQAAAMAAAWANGWIH